MFGSGFSSCTLDEGKAERAMVRALHGATTTTARNRAEIKSSTGRDVGSPAGSKPQDNSKAR